MSTENKSEDIREPSDKQNIGAYEEDHTVSDLGDASPPETSDKNISPELPVDETKPPEVDMLNSDEASDSEMPRDTATPPSPKSSSEWVVVDGERSEGSSPAPAMSGPQFPTEIENTTDNTSDQQTTIETTTVTEPSRPDKKKDEWTYVLGHTKLMKRTLTEGNGTRAAPGQIVSMKCCGVTDDGAQVDKHDSLTFTVQDGDVIQAIDLCVALMELHEVAEVVTEPQYAYGARGRAPDIPSNAKLTYTLELLVIEEKPDYNQLPISRRVQDGDVKRRRGNELYEREEYSAAIQSYMKALSILDDSNQSHEEEASELQRLLDCRLKCFNNLAATQVKVEAWDSAIKSCDDVLKVQPENVKALFRKEKSLAGKGDVDRAIGILRKAMKLEPETKIIHQELSRLVAKHKQQSHSEKELYKKMLGTDKEKTIPKNDNSRWLMYLGGAAATVLVSMGVAYRYLHT